MSDQTQEEKTSALDAKLTLFKDDPDVLLSAAQAGLYLGYTEAALAQWRLKGCGPKFVRVSEKSIRYRKADLIDWIQKRVRRSTSDNGDAA